MDKIRAELFGNSTGTAGQEDFAEEPAWHEPLPLKVPEPTSCPVFLAFGATLILFGVVTLWAFSAVGLLFFIAGVAGWVERMRHERRQ